MISKIFHIETVVLMSSKMCIGCDLGLDNANCVSGSDVRCFFQKVLTTENKSDNLISRAFSDSGIEVEKGMIFMDRNYLYQVDIRRWIENGLDAEIMVPVSGNRVDKKYDVYIQSYLLPIDAVEADMENDTYNAHSMEPGITVYGSWENDEKVYHRWGNDNGFEPLIIERNFNKVAANSVEVTEEFRLLFNLYFNAQKNEYVDVSDGEGITVVKMNDSGYITIHKRYLKTYLAVKEKALIVHINSRCVALDASKKVIKDGLAYRNDENSIFYTLNIGNTITGTKRENYSYIYGKNVIFGCNLCDSNIWPYNEEKNYVDFIIGIDENGKEIRHTCNPSCLSNYYGANPTAPHYLTPVYFDTAVLNKYYSKPEIYKIEDGIIRCGVLWTLYVDNSNPDYVSVYLGDLGRDLPSESEQHYWRGFNKAVGGKLSSTKVKRDFMCIAADSESPDFVFKRTYRRVNQAYEDRFSWPLFLPLTEQDVYNFETLRVPVNNSIAEMDMLVLSLVKILIDSLNEKKITSQLTANYEKLVGSISKLEAWLVEKNIENCDKHIKFLRNLQELRSSGTGHRKGKKYQKITKIIDVKNENYAETFSNLLNGATDFIIFMGDNLEKLV